MRPRRLTQAGADGAVDRTRHAFLQQLLETPIHQVLVLLAPSLRRAVARVLTAMRQEAGVVAGDCALEAFDRLSDELRVDLLGDDQRRHYYDVLPADHPARREKGGH